MQNNGLTLARFGVATVSLLALVGCDSPEPFSGVWMSQSGGSYVKAYFDKFKDNRTHTVVKFDLYQLLKDSRPVPVYMHYSKKHEIAKVTFPLISPKELVFAKTASSSKDEICATSTDLAPRFAMLCYSPHKINFRVMDPSKRSVLMELALRDQVGKVQHFSDVLTLEQALGRVKYNDFKVEQEAEKLFRAQQSIQVARAGVIPRLSASSIINLGLNTTLSYSIMGTITSSVPFVFPSNWYKLKQAKATYEAERESFKALQATEVLTAHTLYYSVTKDLEALQYMQTFLEYLKTTKATMQDQFGLGAIGEERLRSVEEKILSYEVGTKALASSIEREVAALAQAIDIEMFPQRPLTFEKIQFPSFVGLPEKNPAQVSQLVKSKAYELNALRALKKAMHDKVNAEKWSIFNAGDIIGLDAGYAARTRIAISDESEVDSKITETTRGLEEKSIDVCSQYNTALETQSFLEKSLKSQKGKILEMDLPNHKTIDSLSERIDAEEAVLTTQLKILNNQYSLIVAQAVYDRLTQSGYYGEFGPIGKAVVADLR